MPRPCAAYGCTTNSSSKLILFRFPKDEIRCQVWIERAGNGDLVGLASNYLNNAAKLCSRHFPRTEFTNDLQNRLIWKAVPSIFDHQLKIHLPDPTVHEYIVLDLPLVSAEDIPSINVDIPFFNVLLEPDNKIISSDDTLLKHPMNPVDNLALQPCSLESSDICSTPTTSKRPIEEVISDTDRYLLFTPSPKRACRLDGSTLVHTNPSRQPIMAKEDFITPTRATGLDKLNNPSAKAKKFFQNIAQSKLKHAILKAVGATRVSQLSLKEKRMHSMLLKARKRIRALKQRCKEMRLGISDMRSNINSSLIKKIENSVSPVAARLFASQLRCGKKKPRGRRYTMEDKILALSLYKRSPKSYKLMQTFLAMPSPRTLITILNQIPFLPGINNSIFNHLKEKVSKMKKCDRVCSILFDEVSLSTGLHYSEKLDHIIGFEDFGSLGRTKEMANHALVFMARGLRKKFKQPVAYYFCKDVTKTGRLEELIVEVTSALQNAGLRIVCAICDQGTTNVAALDSLVKKNKSSVVLPKYGKCFNINGDDIAIIYDPPHLLKSLRNAFLKYNVSWSTNDETLLNAMDNDGKAEASWDHIKKFFEKDRQTIFQRAVKLTRSHIEPSNQEKMRVKLAAQVLSQQVACGINSMIADPDLFVLGVTGSQAQHHMPSSALWTSHFLLDADRLFDSFNGTRVRAVDMKTHRVALTEKSIHTTFWPEITDKINKWNFIDSSKKDKPRVQRSPFQNGWLTSLHGATFVGKLLREKYKVKVLQTRRLNTDPLENLFCLIRQHGVDNTNPSCSQFCSALKTCIINGMMKVPSRGSNCVADTDNLLSDLKSFLQMAEEPEDDPEPTQSTSDIDSTEPFGPEDQTDEIENENSDFNLDDYDFSEVFEEIIQSESSASAAAPTLAHCERSTVAYVSGYIIRKLVGHKSLENCECCKMALTSSEITTDHIFIHSRERSDKYRCLMYPSTLFVTTMGLAAQVVMSALRESAHIMNLKRTIIDRINNSVDFTWFNCPEHQADIKCRAIILLCRVTIHHHCKVVNRRFKEVKRGEKTPTLPGASKPTPAQKKMKKILHK